MGHWAGSALNCEPQYNGLDLFLCCKAPGADLGDALYQVCRQGRNDAHSHLWETLLAMNCPWLWDWCHWGTLGRLWGSGFTQCSCSIREVTTRAEGKAAHWHLCPLHLPLLWVTSHLLSTFAVKRAAALSGSWFLRQHHCLTVYWVSWPLRASWLTGKPHSPFPLPSTEWWGTKGSKCVHAPVAQKSFWVQGDVEMSGGFILLRTRSDHTEGYLRKVRRNLP